MDGWQPIESALKDGTPVDIWLVDQSGKGERIADARYVFQYPEEYTEYSADGSHKHATRVRDGWWDPNAGYDREGDFCDVPKHYNPHPRQQCWLWTEATHWMLVPPPPKPSTKG